MLTSRTRRIIEVLVVLVVGLLFCGGNQTEAQDIIPASGNNSGISTISDFDFVGFGVEVGTNQDPIEMSHDETAGPWFKTLCFDDTPDRSFYYISQIIEVSGSDLWTGWYEEILTYDWIFVNDGTNNISVLVGGNVPPGLIIDLSEDGRSVSITFDPISPEGGPFININLPAVYDGALEFPPDDCIDTKAYPFGEPASPILELLKQVSLTGGEPFFDTDAPGDADVPTGTIGADATYRLIVRNVGNETLINAVINDPTLGLVNVPVPGGPLAPGDERVITSGDAGFENLFFPNRCDSAGIKENIATVDAEGQSSGAPVIDDDPANVNCEVAADEDGDGIPDDQDECPDTLIPESVPTKRLGTNRFALVDEDTTFDTEAPKGKGPRKAFTIEDTAGCSCEQIIEELALGQGHVKFGCSISSMEEWVDAVNP